MKSKYKLFQDWLNKCPVEIINYVDFTDIFEIQFKVPLEEHKPELPVIQPKKHITTKTIKSNPSFLITLDHDKKHLRIVS